MAVMEKQGITVSPVDMEGRTKLGIKSGDTVRVWVKVEEKGKTRLQPFEGLVLARKHGDTPGATFTVRRVTGGYGVEKIFPLYSPNIDKIEIIKRAKVRRAKLYHIRDKAARQIRRQMRNMRLVSIATESEAARAAVAEESESEAEEPKGDEVPTSSESENAVETEAISSASADDRPKEKENEKTQEEAEEE